MTHIDLTAAVDSVTRQRGKYTDPWRSFSNYAGRFISLRLAADFAEHVLPLFEDDYPHETLPRRTICNFRRWLGGDVSVRISEAEEEMDELIQTLPESRIARAARETAEKLERLLPTLDSPALPEGKARIARRAQRLGSEAAAYAVWWTVRSSEAHCNLSETAHCALEAAGEFADREERRRLLKDELSHSGFIQRLLHACGVRERVLGWLLKMNPASRTWAVAEQRKAFRSDIAQKVSQAAIEEEEAWQIRRARMVVSWFAAADDGSVALLRRFENTEREANLLLQEFCAEREASKG